MDRLGQVFCQLPKREAIGDAAPKLVRGERVMSVRDAMLSESQTLPTEQCLGRVLAVSTVGCPPAVPILVCGERITEETLSCFSYYDIKSCCVVKE